MLCTCMNTAYYSYMYMNCMLILSSGKFIDMILTKGSNAIRSFLQHLGYHYPEIYRRIMKAKPQSPPKGSINTIISD